MGQLIRLDEDWHVRTAFPDDAVQREATVYAAEVRGLKRICLVAEAQRYSDWIGQFARTCRALDRTTAVEISSGVEVEVLDVNGSLDLPPGVRAVDRLYVGVRRLPTPAGPMDLQEARERIATGALLPSRAIEWLVRASANATQREGSIVLAEPLRILSELEIEPCRVHPAYLRWLAGSVAEREAAVELCERWRCPSSSAARWFLMAGATVLASSGSDDPEAVGRYQWCRSLAAELAGCGPRVEPPEPIFVV